MLKLGVNCNITTTQSKIGIAKTVLGMNSWPTRSRRVQHSEQAFTLSANS